MDKLSDGLLQILDICELEQVELWEENTIGKLCFVIFTFSVIPSVL